MAILLPPNGGKRPGKPKRMRPVKLSRRDRAAYLDSLGRMVDILKSATVNLSDLIRGGAGRAQVAIRLTELAAQTQGTIDQLAPSTARSFVSDVDRAQKKAVEASIGQALGVDFARIVDTPEVAAELQLSLTANTALIKSIGASHWSDVSQAVLDNYRGQPLPDGQSLTERLRSIGGITERRAKLIARDQTSKLTGALNQARMQGNGIAEYIWRNAGDTRVVGNPAGKYPKGTRAHGDHWEREGKRFRWDSPPTDGHPGQAIQCRCVAIPVLDPAALEAKYA